MITVETATELRALLKRYLDAQAASTRAQDARGRLEAGSTRARVTSANARLQAACEHRDRLRRSLTNEEEAEAETIAARKTR